MKNLHSVSIQYIKGVGPARLKLFKNLGIETVEDLLYFFPRRYEDRTKMKPIAQLSMGEYQTVSGKIVVSGARNTWHTRKRIFEAVIEDGKSRLFCVWFNQPYLKNYFCVGSEVIVYGRVELYKDRIQMISPEYEIIDRKDDQSLNVNRIVPIYPLTKGMTQRYIRKVVSKCMETYCADMKDPLSVQLRNKYRFVNIRASLKQIHFPESFQKQEEAFRRVSFEEFFLFQLSVIQRRMSIISKKGTGHEIPLNLIKEFYEAFPFSLTNAQKRAVSEIAGDMQQSIPMLRLLQGDVGSGKTLVALFGCMAAFRNQKQSAVMVPTEILARQHYQGIQNLLRNGPFKNLKIGLLVGSLKKKEKDQVLSDIKNGQLDVVIGTHALLSDAVDFFNLSFVVIDEQHKFGVKQRALLSTKGMNPDVLVMTATPIPRTLSLTLFGDLEVSVIDELPKGRGNVTTYLFAPDQEETVYDLVRQSVLKGQQAYIIYPLVEESMKLDLKAAEASYERFKTKEFKDFEVGIVHGQMKKEQTEETMNKFKRNEIQILVATTVLEVGIDVANANVMVIEHAERFGLAQLHQLRGRIGRGKENGVCFLVGDPGTADGSARLKAIMATTDGFQLAEDDLLIRGPGHYFGRHQHGLNELRFANPATQVDILELSRKEAQETTHQDPTLSNDQNKILNQTIQRRYPAYLDLIPSG